MRALPSWLALFAPLPAAAIPQRKPVASAEQIAQGTDGPIAGWESVTLMVSDPGGIRHVHITLDGSGQIIAGGDHAMIAREEIRDGVEFTISDHESIGGRFEEDGSFRGTRWKTHTEGMAAADEASHTTSTSSVPTEEDIAALRRVVAEVMRRDADLRPR